ncbi:glycosyltransferase family 4 protein [Bacillus sp. H-16]|uniref:glycosyltransferase n=1 Tax=Alteribacter salitolerans TaxID=2912333 RepID=UPI0019624D55|nr:glycosyltransferase family 4 protein [Alteribacter salitolerans]
MKVALICTESLPAPAVKGGAIQMFIDGITPFLKEKYQLTIYSISDPNLKNYSAENGTEYIHFPKESYETNVADHLKRRRYDVIHVFNRPANLQLYYNSSPWSRFVLGLHNDMMAVEKISNEEGAEVVRLVSRIVTISYFIKQRVIERFPEAAGKTTVVYSGVDLSKFPLRKSETGIEIRSEYRRRYEVENKKVILFVGRLSRNKGAHLLVDAMKTLVKKHPNLVLMIVGGKWFSDDGMNSYTRDLYRQARSLRNHVIFTRFVPADVIGNMFLMGDIFVCPSQWEEPLARVHYEAMAAGIPIVTTNRGGNGEVILHGQNGYLIDDYTKPEAFIEGIEYYLQAPSLTSYITENGRRFVEANFQFKNAARRVTDVYDSLNRT